MRRTTAIVGAGVLALVAYLGLDAVDVVPGVLTSDVSVRATSPVPGQPEQAPRDAPRAAAPAAVLAPPAAEAPAPTGKALAARLALLLRNPALGTSVGIDVRDGITGAPLFTSGNHRPQTPASLTKVVTAAAVTTAVTDPTLTFSTRVVRGASPTDLVLVAGGDNLLAPGRGTPGATAGRAGLDDLAAQVASRLGAAKGSRTAPLRLQLDDSLARGRALAPGWLAPDVAAGITGPVAMLGLASDRAVPGRAASTDPALAAATALRARLAAHGVTVAPAVTRLNSATPPDAASLGEVRSAPVLDVLALALDDSDNDLTETVARWTCHREGVAATFAACAAWVQSRLGALGVGTTGVRLVDTSGLSEGTTVPAALVSELLVRAANGSDPALARVLSRLPVAGLTGTLADRFHVAGSRAGAGTVRAKTGTLTGVGSLGGSVVDDDGRLLVFTIIADRVPVSGTLAARPALDALATALATCGCR